jgi:hypothetical protein
VKCRMLAMLFGLAVAFAVTAAPTASVSFELDGLSFRQYIHENDTFDIPDVLDVPCRVGDLGAPYLPYVIVRILIPRDRTCIGVRVTSSSAQVLEGEFYVLPAQSQLMTGEPPEFAEPDSTIYSSYDLFPEAPARLVRQGNGGTLPVFTRLRL